MAKQENHYTTTLVIDTALPETVVMLVKDTQLLGSVMSGQVRRADNLLELVSEVLANAQQTLVDLDAIIVRRGLGSYTGLRIGVTTANALAWSLNIPIFGAELTEQRSLNLEDVMDYDFSSPQSTVVPKYGSWHDGLDSAKIFKK